MSVCVIGQLGRDLVVKVDALPPSGGAADVLDRREMLGGKGANQAVGLAQLGVPVTLVGVAGLDAAGDAVLAQAEADGIGISAVARRGTTALLLDVVADGGERRLLEHVPPEALLTAQDVRAAAATIHSADTVVLQLQQPADALVVAAQAVSPEARVVLDGGIDDAEARRVLLRRANVVRADATEISELVDSDVKTRDDARKAAARLLDAGPELVAIAVSGEGDLVSWRDGERFLSLSGDVVDPTGAGDAFVVGLVAALRSGKSPAMAAEAASAAARSTVARLGGRPALSQDLLSL